MGSTNSIKQWFGFVIVMVIGMAWGRPAAAIEYRVSYPPGMPNNVRLAPGESGVFAFDVHNLSAEVGTAEVELRFTTGSFVLDNGNPSQCGPIESRIFSVALQANESLSCSYRLTRSPTAITDIALGLCTGVRNSSSSCDSTLSPNPGVTYFYAGAVPDISITANVALPAFPGASESIIRLTASNASLLATREIPSYSECLPIHQQYPYSLDNAIAGGCPTVVSLIGCQIAIGIPPPIAQWVVRLPAAPPMGESSCLVRMRFNSPLNSSFSDTLSLGNGPLVRVPLALGNNFYGFDPNPANNTIPFGAILPPAVVSVGDKATWVVLCGMLVGIAWRRRTRMRMTSEWQYN